MTLRRALRRLRLREGDILVCRDPLLMEGLMSIRDCKIPAVPIVVDYTGKKNALEVVKEHLDKGAS